MRTSFEILFLLSTIVPPAAVVVGMAVLLGSLLANGRSHAADAAAAHARGMAQGQAVAR
jgi:hypothetical protein